MNVLCHCGHDSRKAKKHLNLTITTCLDYINNRPSYVYIVYMQGGPSGSAYANIPQKQMKTVGLAAARH